MNALILFLLIASQSTAMRETKELKAAEIAAMLRHELKTVPAFKDMEIVAASAEDAEEYFPLKINRTIKTNGQFTFCGIGVEELHAQLDTFGIVQAVYLKLENHGILPKLIDALGAYKVAAGASLSPDMPYSYYAWDYNGVCVDLGLNAYALQLEEKIVRDTAILIFNTCDTRSYLKTPDRKTDNEED